jgi:signal transduction histidine kinase
VTRRRLIAAALLGLALCAISVAVAQANPVASGRSAQVAIAVTTIAALLGVGLYASYRDPDNQFGKVLYLTGVCWFFVTLANSDSAALYSVSRIAGWIFEVVLAYALLSYPTGRLEGRAARTIVIGGALLIALLYLPTIPITDQYPLPAPFTACTAHCPQNIFLSGSEPSVLPDVIKPVRDLLAIAIYIGVVGVIAVRLRGAGHNQRRTLAPVLGAAFLRFVAAIVYVALRRADVDGAGTEVAVFVALLSVPVTALGFLLGLLQWRVYSGGALRRLTTGLVETRDPDDLRGLLAESLEEPQVGLFYADPPEPEDGAGAAVPPWHDASGGVVAAPLSPPRACVHEVSAESGLRVALVCEEGFRDRPEFLDAVCACVVSGLERQRLDAALATSLAEVAASRKRLAGAADSARQQIERDLHDGAQQQLVALRVKLELAREALEGESGQGVDSGQGARMVAGLGPEVEEIIEEVRSLARGIYPALLASDGLGEALRSAGQRLAVPVAIDADGVGRLPSETESAVYFCCLEAMQNVAKHAAGVSGVTIALRREADLRFEVADDGRGFAVDGVPAGSGITGMRDRLAAVGGELWIESAPGQGTRVHGRVPLD